MADLANTRVGFIGAGVMAFALAKGFVESSCVRKEQILMLVRNDVKRSLVEDLGYTAVCDPRDVAVADVIFLSVKPQDAIALLKEISFMVHEKKHLLISICAGVDLKTLTAALNYNRAAVDDDKVMNRRICRVMPNTPCQIRKGVSVFSVGAGCTSADVEVLNTLLSAVGTCYQIDEKHMAAASAISGSGPAFVFTLLDALADGGVKNGLPRKLAQDLAMDMVAGSATLARAEFGRRHFAELKDQVTSPGGTTIAGIAALERWGFRNAVLQAIDATTDRSKDLGG
eukprot:XP_023973496.1 pyrroline-5-carboxylate reductase-like [Physeter catodon]